MSKVVLDASAVLAVLQFETGGDIIAERIRYAHISAVNLTEVVTRLMDKGQSFDRARHAVDTLTMTVEEVDAAQAYFAASLRSATRKSGLSVGDRFSVAAPRTSRRSAILEIDRPQRVGKSRSSSNPERLP